MMLATGYPDANAEHWLMRAQYASWVDAWPDAALAVTTIAKRWPEFIADADDKLISRIAFRANDDGKHKAEKIELLKALFAANFVLEGGSQPDGLWHDLVVDALEHHRPAARARDRQVVSRAPRRCCTCARIADSMRWSRPRSVRSTFTAR